MGLKTRILASRGNFSGGEGAMLNTQEIMDAYERWRANTPAPLTLEEIGSFLKDEYQARPLSLDLIPETNIINDEELRPQCVAAMYTITDTATLLSSAKNPRISRRVSAVP